jgi:cellulose synthase/poly-beta-1,6-N-acetylglucosamine synthase-like glycosyltransferase
MTATGVTFVVPVHNGERCVGEALASILAQGAAQTVEVIAVDDGSTDGSAAILSAFEARDGVRVLRTSGLGAAAAMNLGIREAAHPVICLIDQDVVLKPGWLASILAPFGEAVVGAVQGRFVTDPEAATVARVAAMDVEQRYAAMGAGPTSHVCTGNSAYRARALRDAGLFDQSFGYGYDNDMSYRILTAGYTLRFCPEAESVHRWRETLRGYLNQQYGQGYGRLDIVWKHPGWATGDSVSPAAMMAHAPLMLAALVLGLIAIGLGLAGVPWRLPAWAGGLILAGLAIERAAAGLRAAIRHRDPAGLLFPPLHLLRDGAWAIAIVIWAARRLTGRGRHPLHTMRRR